MKSMYPKSTTVQVKGRSTVSPRKSAAPASPSGASKAASPAPRKARSAAEAKAVAPSRRIQVRRSGVHGKGVFALAPLRKGEVLIEYVGEVIDWEEALRRHPHDPAQPDHTFYFHIDDGRVIDANVGGNAARWMNHSCDPNCEADEVDGRVFIKALRAIKPGEELSYNYGLTIDERYTPALKRKFACWCGAANCRGTMLSPKR